MENYENFFFWWSVVSTILGVIFLVTNAMQLVLWLKEKSLVLKEKEIHRSQVKVWQHHAFGIQRGLFVATLGKYTSVVDVKETVSALWQDAESLYQSLNEERLFTEEEVKAKQIQKEQETQERLKLAQVQSQNILPAATSSSLPTQL